MYNQIINASGEESVIKFINMLKNIFNITVKSYIETNEAGRYLLITNDYEFNYTIVDEDTDKITPDYYIVTNKENFYIEETSCELSSSGNNTQLQRATKFIPKINSNDVCIYYIEGNDINNLKNNNNHYCFKQWKTTNIKVHFKNEDTMKYYSQLEPYTNYEELTSHYKDIVKENFAHILTYDKKTNCILIILNIYKSKYNLLKKGSLNNDPGKGSLSLLLLTIHNISKKNNLKKPTIILENIVLQQNQIIYSHCGNKILRSINHFIINGGYDIRFKFTNNIVFDINKFNSYTNICPFKNRVSHSEKIVSMHHRTYKTEKNEIILFENHARSENSKINNITFPKFKTGKPDMIIKNDNKIYFIEAETYNNLKKGLKQIEKWSHSKELYDFYILKCKFKEKLEFYIELYDKQCLFNGDFSDTKFNHVRFILNSKCVWFVNHNYIPYYFKL